MRPIDADALIEKCGDWYVEEGTESGFIGTLKNLLATMPTIQPQSTTGQLNDGARSTAQSTDLIDRQQALKALRKCQTYLYDARDPELKIKLSSAKAVINNLPTIQPEATDKVRFGDKDHVWIDGKQYISLRRFQEAVKEAQPKEGEWVQIQRCTGDAQPDLECPFCKHRIGWFDMGRYCAGCGAKLKGGAG